MSWIFTIVFSGLIFSSNQGAAFDVPKAPDANTTAAAKADETEHFEQTYPLSSNGRVSVSNVNGSIVVEAWDRNEVQVVADKTADSKERLQDVEIRVNAKPDSISVETNYDRWKSGNNGDRWKNGSKLVVEYRLMVPRGAVLDEVETVNGSVSISNFTNFTKASAVNGTVKAANLRGTANLSTVNGEVAADFGTLDTGSKISLSTVNGKVNLTLPSDANATIKVDSLNGTITNDFGLPVRKGKYVGRDLYGKLGSGEVRIKMDSVNGDLRISRQNDGKSPSPVTNLLPQKEKDDEDWDGMDSDAAKVDAEAARIDREASRKERAAMKEAQKEIAKIQPEIARATAESARRAAEAIQSEAVQTAIRDGIRQSAVVLAGIKDAAFFPSIPRVERKSNSFPVKGVPKVSVETHGCAVKITGWDKPEVSYSVSQTTSTRDRSPIDIKESHDDSSVTLTVNADEDRERTRIEIFVPKKSDLKIKTDSEIRLEGVSGEVDLTGADEAINVRDVDGKLSVTNADGSVRIIGFRGELRSETVDGMLSIEGDFSKLNARAQNGTILVTMPEASSADISSNSPDTSVEGLPLVLVSEKEGQRDYRLGRGGPAVQITTEGKVTLRGAGSIESTF